MADVTSLSRLTDVINLEFVLLLYSRRYTIMRFYIWKLDLLSSPIQHYTNCGAKNSIVVYCLDFIIIHGFADSQLHVFLPLNRLYISLTRTEVALTLTEFVSFSFFSVVIVYVFCFSLHPSCVSVSLSGVEHRGQT